MDHVYSIQEITGIIKSLFEQNFSSLRIAGEISNCRPSSTGHLYFTLKDEKAALQAVMFKGRTWTLGFEPKDGLKVIVSGSLSVYEQRGSYQIIVETMELAGEGAILKMLEERKQKLAREGLFDRDRKPIAVFSAPYRRDYQPNGRRPARYPHCTFAQEPHGKCYRASRSRSGSGGGACAGTPAGNRQSV